MANKTKKHRIETNNENLQTQELKQNGPQNNKNKDATTNEPHKHNNT